MARVLVVDDDPAIRKVLRKVCELEGHEVVEAADGKSGEAAVTERPPDLVITDIYMPEGDGYALIRALRRQARPVKVIAISGGAWDDASQALDMARALGAHATLTKPFDLTAATNAIRAALGTSQD